MSTLGQLGPYELLKPLGEGGMAETFVAVRRGPAGFEQRVCLKRILPSRAAEPMFLELFQDEARLLARMQCRNIVHVHDFGQVDDTYYMALELVEGVDLAHLLAALERRQAMMPEALALYVVSEVLAALSYAHTLALDGELLGIVHRDISPSNILISNHGEVKLTDFGIAKARGRQHRTQTGHTKGKAAYMSPEQVRAGAVDGRSDLFSLGVVLFELLTGVHPFDASTDLAIQLSIMSGRRPSLQEFRPDLPPAIGQLVDAMLATDPAARPQSAAAALAMLPHAAPAFVLQQQLAQLVATREEGGFDTPRRALPSRPRTVTEQELAQMARALSSSSEPVAPLPSPARAADTAGAVRPLGTAATQPAWRSGSSTRWALLGGACMLVALAAGYLLLRGDRSVHGELQPVAVPALPTQTPAPAGGSEAPDAAVATTRKTPAERVTDVISPPKGGPTQPKQPVDRVITPPKAPREPARERVEQVISPPKGGAPSRPMPVELVVSPPK